MRLLSVVCAFFLLLLVSSFPQPAASPPPAAQGGAATAPKASTPKRIVAAIRGDPHTLSDAINYAGGGSSVAGVREIEQLLTAGLTVMDAKGNLQPQLAEAVPTLENGLWKLLPDGRMETTWKIKKSATWHDGQPVTSGDLVFATSVAQDKGLAMRADEAFGYVESVAAPDAQTFVATWKSTYADADKLFTPLPDSQRNVPLPEHLLGSAYAGDKAAFTDSPYFGASYVGTGPFKLHEWVLGSHVLLDANDQYVLGRPRLDQIEVKFILDTNTMVAN